MAWNEPGGNDNDPWGNQKNKDGPPDLDEVFKNIRKKADRLFGGKGGGNRSNGSGGSMGRIPGGSFGGWGLAVGGVIALALWLASGFYIVEPAESAVVTRFGAYTKTDDSGFHWRMPWPIERTEIIDVDELKSVKLQEIITLTQDENLVKLTLSVQYIIGNARDYLFNVERPDNTLVEVVESALREAIGQADMDEILTTQAVPVEVKTDDDDADKDATDLVLDPSVLQSTTFENVQRILDEYEAGLTVMRVLLEQAQPPDQVQAAFSDVIRAREDRERIISEAEAYRNEILPIARGDAVRITEEATGYKTRVEQSAIGESQRFLSLLHEFEKAPAVTRERLYIEAMENVLGNTSKVMVDSQQGGGNSLMYLPIDKLINQPNQSQNNNNNLFRGSNTGSSTLNDIQLEPSVTTRDTGRSRDRGALR